MKQRFKSYKFWTALAGALIIFIQALGKAFHFEIDPSVIDGIVMGFCGVLVVFGIVEKPTTDETEKDNSHNQKEIRSTDNTSEKVDSDLKNFLGQVDKDINDKLNIISLNSENDLKILDSTDKIIDQISNDTDNQRDN